MSMSKRPIRALVWRLLALVARLVPPAPRMTVLLYHSISDGGDFFAVSPGEFRRQMEYLKQQMDIASLERAFRHAKGERILRNSVAITFDDGYDNAYTKAMPILQKYDFIPSEEAAGIENLVKDTAEVLADVKKIVHTLKDSIAPDNGESPVKEILADVSELVKSTKDAAQTLKRIMGSNEDKIAALVDNLEAFSDQLAYQVDNGNKDSAMADIKQILANVNKMTQDVQSIVADLKKGKGTLGKMLVEDEIADQVKDTLSSVQKIVGKAENLRTELSVFSGMNTRSGGDSDFALRIYPAPERFYHLGVVTSEFGPDRERTSDITTNGTKVTETRVERDKNTYRFNAQVGRRIQDLAFRGGMIESTGGLGLDYHFNPIATKFSVEAFDYKKSIGANLRLSTETQVWNVLYGKASFNDTLRKERLKRLAGISLVNKEKLHGKKLVNPNI